jgi:hypothetical protein
MAVKLQGQGCGLAAQMARGNPVEQDRIPQGRVRRKSFCLRQGRGGQDRSLLPAFRSCWMAKQGAKISQYIPSALAW